MDGWISPISCHACDLRFSSIASFMNHYVESHIELPVIQLDPEPAPAPASVPARAPSNIQPPISDNIDNDFSFQNSELNPDELTNFPGEFRFLPDSSNPGKVVLRSNAQTNRDDDNAPPAPAPAPASPKELPVTETKASSNEVDESSHSPVKSPSRVSEEVVDESAQPPVIDPRPSTPAPAADASSQSPATATKPSSSSAVDEPKARVAPKRKFCETLDP